MSGRNPEQLSLAMAGQDPDDCDGEQSPSPAPWYNRTPVVIGASVVGLAVTGVLIVVYITVQWP